MKCELDLGGSWTSHENIILMGGIYDEDTFNVDMVHLRDAQVYIAALNGSTSPTC